MTPSLRMQQVPVAAGAVTLAVLMAAELLLPKSWREEFREAAFDLVLAADRSLQPAAGNHKRSRVIVVDIDRRSLDAVGPWPWPRATIAGLIEAIAVAKPEVAAIDILFAEHDSRFPAALARQLGTPTAHDECDAGRRPIDRWRQAPRAGGKPGSARPWLRAGPERTQLAAPGAGRHARIAVARRPVERRRRSRTTVRRRREGQWNRCTVVARR